MTSVCALLLLAGPGSQAAITPAPFAGTITADVPLSVMTFSVSTRTGVPGTILKAGTYSIRVVDHLSDRVILRIEDPSGKTLTTFLGLPNPSIASAGSGAIPWPNGPHKQGALRGFAFPGGSSVEFVYPKADAVEIAKVNSSKVAAIDPASEGKPANSQKLSPSDLQMLSLWALSSTRVGPADSSQPAIQAERYRPVQEARNEIPAPPPVPARSSSPQSAVVAGGTSSNAPRMRPAPRAANSPVQRAAVATRSSGLKELPHTASSTPAIVLGGALCFLLAGFMRMRRMATDAA